MRKRRDRCHTRGRRDKHSARDGLRERERDDPTHLRITAATAATKLPCGFWSLVEPPPPLRAKIHGVVWMAVPSPTLGGGSSGALHGQQTRTTRQLRCRGCRGAAQMCGVISLSFSLRPARALVQCPHALAFSTLAFRAPITFRRGDSACSRERERPRLPVGGAPGFARGASGARQKK